MSEISVWEIAVKSSLGKLTLPLPIDEWYALAQTHSGIVIERLNPVDAIATHTATRQFSSRSSRQNSSCDRALHTLRERKTLWNSFNHLRYHVMQLITYAHPENPNPLSSPALSPLHEERGRD